MDDVIHNKTYFKTSLHSDADFITVTKMKDIF